jgi:hypothetical protein
MKILFLVFSPLTIQCTQSTVTHAYAYESHFIKELNDGFEWRSCNYNVTISGSQMVIDDRSKSYTYAIKKESIPKPDKGYTVYEVIIKATPLMIMRPKDWSYVSIMNEKDSTVWMLSKTAF